MLLFACNTTPTTVTIAKARPRGIVLILGKEIINVYVLRLLVSKERGERGREEREREEGREDVVKCIALIWG